METGEKVFNKDIIVTKIGWSLFLVLGIAIIYFCLFSSIGRTLWPAEILPLKWCLLAIGVGLSLAGGTALIGVPASTSDCPYKKTVFITKDKLDVFYDMGHKIMIAYKNQGGVYTGRLKQLRELEKFRIVLYYRKKTDTEPHMWNFVIF